MSETHHWIERLGLEPHPEGGYYAECYRSPQTVQTPRGPRSAGTSIYFLLDLPDFSAFHRLQADEIWHFYAGSALTIWVIAQSGELKTLRLGNDLEDGQSLQLVVPANTWFAARPDGWALAGCTMAPGFDYADFELAERAGLTRQYPQHAALIERLTRS